MDIKDVPNLKTKDEAIKVQIKDGEHFSKVVLSGMFGNVSRLPEFNDADEIYRSASKEFRHHDFSNAGSYIDSLVQLVDYWKRMAEHYLYCVDETKYLMDEYGNLDKVKKEVDVK